jgi:hypothetical protein
MYSMSLSMGWNAIAVYEKKEREKSRLLAVSRPMYKDNNETK